MEKSMRIISKADFDRIGADYKGTFADYHGTHPEWKGRRTAFLPGEGTTLFIEGVHFLVEDDYSHLPILCKLNARVGDCYRFAGGYVQVTKISRLSEEYALEHDLYYLDRVEFIQHAKWGTRPGGCALAGSDLREDLR